MWIYSRSLLNPLRNVIPQLLNNNVDPLVQQTRNTFILKRKFPPNLHKKGQPVERLRKRHYIYKLVEDANLRKQAPLNVILTTHVQGYGNRGEKVSLSPNKAYKMLLLPGLAVYASPENTKKYETESEKSEEGDTYPSSKTVHITLKKLKSLNLMVHMSQDNPWTLQNWHMKANFRRAGIVVPEDALELPKKVISGPDLEKDMKEFYVTVTINKREKVIVRCTLLHYTSNPSNQITRPDEFWTSHHEPMFEEFKEVLESLPKHLLVLKAEKEKARNVNFYE